MFNSRYYTNIQLKRKLIYLESASILKNVFISINTNEKGEG